jgi:hypothetical protein
VRQFITAFQPLCGFSKAAKGRKAANKFPHSNSAPLAVRILGNTMY